MKIDSHQHFWRYDAVRDAWITDSMAVLRRDFLPEHLAAECAANGIDASIAVQADQSESETMFLLDLAEKNKRIAGVVGWVDLSSPRVGERLEYFSHSSKLRGFRHIAQSEPDDCFLVRENFVKGVAQLRAFGFTYDILIYPRQLPAAIQLVARLPEQRFVVDHLAKPEIKSGKTAPWAAQMKEIAQNKSVFCKLSGLWRFRSRSFDVRLRLAGMPAGRNISPGETDNRRIRERVLSKRQGQDFRRQRRSFLRAENGATWTCSLRAR
jgi:L-fuconolactonase